MRHVQVALGHLRAVAVEHVKGRDGAGRRLIGHVQQPVLRDEFAHALQIWASQHEKARRLEYAQELGQRCGHIVNVQMLDVVAGVDCVDAGAAHGAHIGHRADEVGRDIGVDVKAQFAPGWGVECGGGAGLGLVAAANV